MFRNLLSRLFSDEPLPRPLASEDAEVAVAALLVRVARADDHYTAAERERIDRVLARRRGLNPEEATARRLAAEMIEAEAPDTVRFTRLVKERIALDDRIGVIAAMWEVAYADNQRSAGEESLIRLVAGLLGVTDRESAVARQQVMARIGVPEG
ncbi:MAG: TerB family tellurite resistance protein [Paracoccus sp. (in: a-proteobacteria)]|uniref:tellurite resistance TerB family protein n=1 Tax=Paracoccus sp. TaxID=267 RepID=UPI0026DFBA10|nr:TerB family tellurite resistance protein [Paracoccus sp. (in: a-proteobacteria)]MDO5632155.1 TerB family tellurite resistance protein [Paracoccus sp. (in: a-proteobacteria)]